jgi:methionyl-tRNA formyltransferase
MLPKEVWEEPSLGTFNLHASLLPLYRGAAPINWAIINGEKETGLTTFLIDDKIDTGSILYRESVKIEEGETAGSLHDKLMKMGPLLIVKTIEALCAGAVEPVSQESLPEFTRQPLPTAPKLSKETGALDPYQKADRLYALIRGLSPYPGSYFEVSPEKGEPFKLRIGEVSFTEKRGQRVNLQISGTQSGDFCFDGDSGSLIIKSVQVPGKRMVKSSEFLNGWRGGTIRLNRP